MARNTWVSNFGKSVKFGSVEVAKELNPAITKLYNENKEFMTNLNNTLSDIMKGQGSILKSIERDETGKVILDAAHALKSDFKTFLKTGSIPGTPGGPGTKDPAAAMGLDMGDMGDMSGGGEDFKMDDDVLKKLY